MLVHNVLKIRNFFKQRGDEEYIDSGMLLRHGSAFTLYLIAAVFDMLTFLVYSIYSENQTVWIIYVVEDDFMTLVSFLSQLLLCSIIFVLGKNLKAKPVEAERAPTIADQQELQEVPEAQPWDEEAELQANMWNTFVRTLPDEAENIYRISAG